MIFSSGKLKGDFKDEVTFKLGFKGRVGVFQVRKD